MQRVYVGRILATTVLLSSCLLLLQNCYVAQAMPPFKSYYCVVATFRLYIFKKIYVVLDLLEDRAGRNQY